MGRAFVYNTGSSDDDKKDDELRLEFGVFIDGTLNNKKIPKCGENTARKTKIVS